MQVRGKLCGIAAVAVAILFASGNAWTQSTEVPAPASPLSQGSVQPIPARTDVMWGPDDAFNFVGFEAGFAGKTVTGTPFTASVSTHMTQTLADGNRIERSTQGTIARDSQGRTRRDIALPAIGPWAASGQAAPDMVFINDPVAGTAYILDMDQKTAHPIERRIWNGQRGAPGTGFAGKLLGGQNNKVEKNLGTKTINGVTAQGTRIRRTIPAGEFGNVKPIKIVIERWYSPDLQMNVLVKRSDPRMGQTIFQLTDIQRKEPDASLFQVPSDYTITRGPGGRGLFGRGRGRGQPPPAGENEPEQARPPLTSPQVAPQQ